MLEVDGLELFAQQVFHCHTGMKGGSPAGGSLWKSAEDCLRLTRTLIIKELLCQNQFCLTYPPVQV
jgi:hypothetical protein